MTDSELLRDYVTTGVFTTQRYNEIIESHPLFLTGAYFIKDLQFTVAFYNCDLHVWIHVDTRLQIAD